MSVPKIDKMGASWPKMVQLDIDSRLTKCAVKKTIPFLLTSTISKINVARSFLITMAVI